MFLKFKNNLKTVGLILIVTFTLTVLTAFLISVFASQIQMEELSPLTSKTIVQERRSKEQATTGSLVKVVDSIKEVKVVNLDFRIVTDKGEDLLVLINKKIGLAANFVPSNLINIENLVPAYAGAQLKQEAASALKEMLTSVKTEKGFDFTIVSAYRSYQDQVQVFNSWVASAGLKSAESFSARAGHSQHQLGTTVDIGVAGKANFNEAFGNTPEGVWLAENAYKFGFVLSYPKGKEKITGYNYEPWHYRFIGKTNATSMVSSGLILEEYLQKYGTW